MDLERKLSELLHELPQKRDEFEELRAQLEREREGRRAAEAEAGAQRAGAESAATQLDYANRALRKCEEALTAARENAVRHGLANQAANQLVEAMREQAHKLHLENTKLKNQMDELQKDLKSETFFRESVIAKQAKIESAIETLCMHRQKLEKDYKEMDRHANEAILVGNKMKLMLEHKDETIKELKEKCEELSSKAIRITSEKEKLEEGMKGINDEESDYDKEMMKEWEASMNEMKARSESHENELDTLQKALQNAVSAQLMIGKLESAANEKIKDLELRLQVAKENKKNDTDASVQTEGKRMADAACETYPEPTHADAATQTVQLATPPQVQGDIRAIDANPPEGEIDPPSNQVNLAEQSNTIQDYSYLNMHSYSSILTNNSFTSNCSLGMLMSKYQQQREQDEARETAKEQISTEELSEMPTQLNNNIKNINYENN